MSANKAALARVVLMMSSPGGVQNMEEPIVARCFLVCGVFFVVSYLYQDSNKNVPVTVFLCLNMYLFDAYNFLFLNFLHF